MAKFFIETRFTFTGTFEVEADNKKQALEKVEQSCSMTIGSGVHSSLPDDQIQWDFPTHPEKQLVSLSGGTVSPKEQAIYDAMGHYLSSDEENYPKIVEALKTALKTDPDDFLDHVIYDEEEETTIEVWEKVEFKFTVSEFCDLVGIN